MCIVSNCQWSQIECLQEFSAVELLNVYGKSLQLNYLYMVTNFHRVMLNVCGK